MENTSNTRTEKIQNSWQLKIYVTPSVGGDFLTSEIERIIEFKLVDQPTCADIVITIEQNLLTICPQNKEIAIKPFSLPFSSINTKKILADLSTFYFESREYTTNFLNTTLIEKKHTHFDSGLKKLEKQVLQIKHEGFHSIQKNFHEINETDKLLAKCKSIYDLPGLMLNLAEFKNYQSCQILIHEKGKMFAENLLLGKKKELLSSKIAIVHFNEIHTIIKKSKSKIFNQTNLLNQNLGILGTFLGREINLSKHSIIIILSRNDFLPASPVEQAFFRDTIKKITTVLSKLLIEYLAQKKNNLLKLGLINLNFPFEIRDQTGRMILSNNHNNTYYSNQINIDKDYVLYFTPLNQASQTSDLHHFQRISLLGELLNTLRHELNNPLFGLKLTSELLSNEVISQDTRDTLLDISTNCERCQNIITNFSLLYKNQETQKNINLSSLLSECLILTKSETRGIVKEIIFDKEIPKNDFSLQTNPTWLTQIIFNFIINSAQAIKSISSNYQNHKIDIQVSKQYRNDESRIIINVHDTGPGVPQEIMDRILQPFVTSKKEGTGLGLSICNYLAEKLGGKIIFFNNTPLPGATFSIELPIKNPY